MKKLIEFLTNLFQTKASAQTNTSASLSFAPRQYPISSPLTNRERLYTAAATFLGRDASPKNLADKDVACAESVSHVLAIAGFNVGKILSTLELGQTLLNDKRFVKINTIDVDAGDIIIYESGTGNGKIPHGHTGIVGINADVMSNNSDSGLWDLHLTLGSMKQRYQVIGGMVPHYFRVIG